MKKRVLFCALCFLVAASLSAQNAGARASIFAPFVSDLRANVTGRLVTLHWRDSPSALGPVSVFRTLTPVYQGMDFSQFQPIIVRYGAQEFSEEVGETGDHYYFVAASDGDDLRGVKNNRYDILVPNNNTIKIVVDGSIRSFAAGALPSSSSASAKAAASLSPSRRIDSTAGGRVPARNIDTPEVYNLNAVYSGGAITVSWGTTNRSKTPVLYRSSTQIKALGDIMKAEWDRTGVSSPFVDHPPAGIPYYYAVLFDEDVRMGNAVVFPGANSTIVSATIPLASGAVQTGPAPTPPNPAAASTPTEQGIAKPVGNLAPEGVLAPNALSSPVPIRQVDVPIPVTPVDSSGAALSPPVTSSAPYATTSTGTDYIAQPATPITENRPWNAPPEPIRYASSASPVIAGSDGSLFPTNTATTTIPNGSASYGATQVLPQTTPISSPAVRNNVEVKTEPRVFSQDMKKEYPRGEEYDLAVIVQGPFMWRQWNTAIADLTRFLAAHDAAAQRGTVATYTASEGRARFYLGQARYFGGDYRGALDQFNAIRPRYSNEIESWIQSCLALIAAGM